MSDPYESSLTTVISFEVLDENGKVVQTGQAIVPPASDGEEK